MIGRVSRAVDDWQARVALAERARRRVLTDIKIGAAFPDGASAAIRLRRACS